MKPHIHAAVIHAWADGAVIQCRASRIHSNWVPASSPIWDEYTEYRASIAEVEGKPVFEGDVLYLKRSGAECVILGVTNYPNFADDYSWNPPKKTITVTIPSPDLPMSQCAHTLHLVFSSNKDATQAILAIAEALKDKP